ncbi:MAG: hypothetical protein PHS30_10385 [Bacteroidales bacterium]|nr:hypothetical protein [Bacteroidales bacterium]
MDNISLFFRFIYRIQRWLIIGPLIVTAIAIYFTSNLPRDYEASTTIFTGIMSSPNVQDEKNYDWNATNNAFDNIMNLVRSRSTLERVSIRLFAQAMIKGNAHEDNLYIKAENYNSLLKIVPKDVKQLIDKNDEEQTVQNLLNYKKEDRDNFLYGLLNWSYPYYSFKALSSISVSRLGSSDMIEMKYSCEDPGIATQTLSILNEELINEYANLQLGPSNNVIDYFENQLKLIQAQLNKQEDSLILFNVKSKIINYEEQTKQLTAISAEINSKYEQAMMDFYSSRKLINKLEAQLDTRADLMKENKQFIRTMDEVALLTRKITELEVFGQENSTEQIENLPRYKQLLDGSEQKLYDITNNVNAKMYSKEGVALNGVVQEWLNYVLQNEKSKAEISTLKDRKKDIDTEYLRYTPIGPNLKKQEREINVSEESYHTILTHLAQARLQQKNIQMISAALKVVAPPIYPLNAARTKRKLIVLVAFIGSLLFILGFFVILEILDKTIRDKNRAKRLTKANILGAFPGSLGHSQRGFEKENGRIASSYVCNMLQKHFVPHGPTFINLISIESGEGRSFIAENLMENWEEKGLSVQILSYESDFDTESKKFLMSENIHDLFQSNSKFQPDVVLVEYPSLQDCNIPKVFIQQAQVNLFIVKATRAWKGSDQVHLENITTQAGETPVYLLINNAQKFAVEDFTGQLPPYTRFSKRVYELLNLGLTAERNKNIE